MSSWWQKGQKALFFFLFFTTVVIQIQLQVCTFSATYDHSYKDHYILAPIKSPGCPFSPPSCAQGGWCFSHLACMYGCCLTPLSCICICCQWDWWLKQQEKWCWCWWKGGSSQRKPGDDSEIFEALPPLVASLPVCVADILLTPQSLIRHLCWSPLSLVTLCPDETKPSLDG